MPPKKNVWIFPVVCGSAMLLGAGLLTYRKIMYDPELKLNASARQSPIMDNREKALEYQAHRSYFGKFDSYVKRPEKVATFPSRRRGSKSDQETEVPVESPAEAK